MNENEKLKKLLEWSKEEWLKCVDKANNPNNLMPHFWVAQGSAFKLLSDKIKELLDE